MRDRPLIPLLILLLVLVRCSQLVQPGTLSTTWVANTMRFAVPLAILAACQTLTMLTGGIDLSVGMVASMAAYVMATQVPSQGPLVAVVVALLVGALAGLVNGIGIGVFRVHPLIMTLAMSLVVLGSLPSTSGMAQRGARVPESSAGWAAVPRWGCVPTTCLSSCRSRR